jgi:hypothetical protein
MASIQRATPTEVFFVMRTLFYKLKQFIFAKEEVGTNVPAIILLSPDIKQVGLLQSIKQKLIARRQK